MKIEEGKPHMTLPNGDKVYEGGFARTRNGRRVGPVYQNNSRHDWRWSVPQEYITYADDGTHLYWGGEASNDLIAEWTDEPETQPETPKLWRDMTPEEKGALLLAAHEGEVIEAYDPYGYAPRWMEIGNPAFDSDTIAYRIRPEPKRETVALCWKKGLAMGEVGTIDLIDGQPDPASIRMEALK